VVMQIGMQPNDVLGAALSMTSVALSSAPVATWSLCRVGFLGLSLGLTATTKLALLPCVAGTGLFVLGTTMSNSCWRTSRLVLGRLAVLAFTFFIVVAPWWTRNTFRYGNPAYPAGIPLLGRGVFVSDFGTIDREFVPHQVAWPLYPLIEPHDDRSGHG